mmetsp:Transcript_40996/g.87323  ORF Transcript_40996/g.87323 Transcript_40996/m.87323 type:complete len:303 (-) Transcript_40996:31-939(-)
MAPAMPEGCRKLLLSPFEVHFSQTRIRAEFQDGRRLEETTPQIEAVEGSTVAATCDAQSVAPSPEAALAKGEDNAILLLRAPFPSIEVTKWHCKLREADGTPRLDPDTGLELYSEEERWFTFDNRRLCCLQRAAAAVWPREARCEVIEIPPTLARLRELRKFDTRTFGCSVIVGRRDDPNPETWCWRSAVGVPEELQPEGGVARQRSSTARWRGGGAGRGVDGRGRRRRSGAGGDQEEPWEWEDWSAYMLENGRNLLLFLLVYLALRLGLGLLRTMPWSPMGADKGAGSALSSAGSTDAGSL